MNVLKRSSSMSDKHNNYHANNTVDDEDTSIDNNKNQQPLKRSSSSPALFLDGSSAKHYPNILSLTDVVMGRIISFFELGDAEYALKLRSLWEMFYYHDRKVSLQRLDPLQLKQTCRKLNSMLTFKFIVDHAYVADVFWEFCPYIPMNAGILDALRKHPKFANCGHCDYNTKHNIARCCNINVDGGVVEHVHYQYVCEACDNRLRCSGCNAIGKYSSFLFILHPLLRLNFVFTIDHFHFSLTVCERCYKDYKWGLDNPGINGREASPDDRRKRHRCGREVHNCKKVRNLELKDWPAIDREVRKQAKMENQILDVYVHLCDGWDQKDKTAIGRELSREEVGQLSIADCWEKLNALEIDPAFVHWRNYPEDLSAIRYGINLFRFLETVDKESDEDEREKLFWLRLYLN